MGYKHTTIIIEALFIGCFSPTPQQGKIVSDHSGIPEKMIISVGGAVYYPQDGGKPQGMRRTSYRVEVRGKDLYYGDSSLTGRNQAGDCKSMANRME
jgi:hypothetical protein